MRIMLVQQRGPFLTRAQPAMEVCAQILRDCRHEEITLDFSDVLQMSPSFANTMFFNLLNQLSEEVFRARIHIENAAPHIRASIDTAVARKVQHRAALTAYLPAPV